MNLEEKLHKEFDWMTVKHIDSDKIVANIISICQQEIDEACKNARIDENQKWINSEYHSRFKGILKYEFSNRIIELSKPSPKESV